MGKPPICSLLFSLVLAFHEFWRQYELVGAELRIICSLVVVTGRLLRCVVIVDTEILSAAWELCVDDSPLEVAVRALDIEGITCEMSSLL